MRIFISYSRKDESFFKDLAAALAIRKYEVCYDKAPVDANNVDLGISVEDEWWKQLQNMIANSDAMVFIVSPHSASSKVCDDEVAYARSLGKRIIPVLCKPVDFEAASPRIAALNVRINFTGNADDAFLAGVTELCGALDLDVEWYREARRLTAMAARWAQNGRRDELLATSGDVRSVGELLEKRPASTYDELLLLREFRDRSRGSLENQELVKRRLQFAMITFLIAMIFGLVAWINQEYIVQQWRWFTLVRPFLVQNITPYVIANSEEAGLKPGSKFRECHSSKRVNYCPEMIVVPSGSFIMGSPIEEQDRDVNEGPQHVVVIPKKFAISIFKITFDEWDTCVKYGTCAAGISDSGFGRGDRPVINLTIIEARQYVSWLSRITGKEYSLLSEEQYEYAARGGHSTVYPWGNVLGVNNANCKDCGSQWDYRQTSPVGSFLPNSFGLYDMVGNTFEWVDDCYSPNYEKSPDNGSSPKAGVCSKFVVRGGSWNFPASNVRSAARSVSAGTSRASFVSFRVARTIGQK